MKQVYVISSYDCFNFERQINDKIKQFEDNEWEVDDIKISADSNNRMVAVIIYERDDE